jgi:hypothetical protein
VLGVPVSAETRPTLHLDGGDVRFAEAKHEPQEGLVEIAVELPSELRQRGATIELGGVRMRLLEPSPS